MKYYCVIKKMSRRLQKNIFEDALVSRRGPLLVRANVQTLHFAFENRFY